MPVRSICMWLCFAVTVPVSGRLPAQESVPSDETPEVVYVDPGEFLPEGFREVTPDDDRQLPLGDIAMVIRAETGIDVIVDEQNLLDEGFSKDDLVLWSGSVPVHVALDRLCRNASGVRLGWFVRDDVLVITSNTIADEVRFTHPWDALPFADLGFTSDELAECIRLAWSPREWINTQPVGNVVHVRTTFVGQLRIAGLLRALKSSGLVRYIDQGELNRPAREALSRKLVIPESELTLTELAAEIERSCEVPVRIDEGGLLDDGVSPNEIVYLPGIRLHMNRLVENVAGVALEFIPRHGALELVTASVAESEEISVLYDVSDLLERGASFDDLIEVIQNETAGPWFDGRSLISEIKPVGLLLVYHHEGVHRDIRALLADQRRLMQPTEPSAEDLAEVRIIGYELKLETADDVVDLIPELIAPETWRTDEHPDRAGWIRVVSLGYRPDVDAFGFGGNGFFSLLDENAEEETAEASGTTNSAEKYGVLLIRQTRAVHSEIEDWLGALHSTRYRDFQSTIRSVDLTVD